MSPTTTAPLPVNITIHGLDRDLAEAFRDYAAKAGQSLNAAAKELFRRALGLPTVEEQERINAWKRWEERYGHFSEEDLRPLREALALQSQIEPEMWKWSATTDLYAKVFRSLREAGHPIPVNDIWLAAQALEHGAVLVSNDRHFEAVSNLLTLIAE